MEELKQSTLSETEQLRVTMLGRLQHLLDEIELHRKDKKLPIGLIHEMHLVTRSMIELLGVRKPIVERLEVRKKSITFQTYIGQAPVGTFTLEQRELALGEGDGDEQY